MKLTGKILLIDDDQTTLLLIKRYLEGSPYFIHTATEARQGLQILKDNPEISLIIVDYMMPHMTGVEVLHAVQDMSPEPFILLMSSLSKEQIPSGLHADGFIKKPISKTNLLEVISKGIQTYSERMSGRKESPFQQEDGTDS
ncbi:MAG: response regulator [Candidatus Nitronauta litoralis]|uniref:Response regulator n=1 Tax=Candidatus Nitronauta litoralis TaxID=2705533 RepID=A0A7T0BYR1_9BACT|nr:MAG: response regulator [Candidatus Nitronauta litoralis]